MADLTGMFDEGTDLDTRLEAASHLLKAAADEQGVDLNDFSEEELSEMIGDIADDDGDQDSGDGEEGGKMASGELTVADVSLELNKRAAAEDVDLSQLDSDQYRELFDKVAQEMSDPYYYEESQKFAMQAANMDELGRVAARGFVDEINKLAGDESDDIDYRMARAIDVVKEAAWGRETARKAWEGTKNLGRKLHKWEQTQHGRLGGVIRGKEKSRGDLAEFGPKNTRVGRMVTGGTAAAGAAGATYAARRGGKNSHGGGRRKRASLEDIASAVDFLRAEGYDL